MESILKYDSRICGWGLGFLDSSSLSLETRDTSLYLKFTSHLQTVPTWCWGKGLRERRPVGQCDWTCKGQTSLQRNFPQPLRGSSKNIVSQFLEQNCLVPESKTSWHKAFPHRYCPQSLQCPMTLETRKGYFNRKHFKVRKRSCPSETFRRFRLVPSARSLSLVLQF